MNGRSLRASINQTEVGTLQEVAGLWSFQYADAWLDTSLRFALSPHLPLATESLLDGASQRPVQKEQPNACWKTCGGTTPSIGALGGVRCTERLRLSGLSGRYEIVRCGGIFFDLAPTHEESSSGISTVDANKSASASMSGIWAPAPKWRRALPSSLAISCPCRFRSASRSGAVLFAWQCRGARSGVQPASISSSSKG